MFDILASPAAPRLASEEQDRQDELLTVEQAGCRRQARRKRFSSLHYTFDST